MTDLVYLMGNLVDGKGHLLVPHIYDSVKAETDEELTSYEPIDFDMVSDLHCVLLGCSSRCVGLLSQQVL